MQRTQTDGVPVFSILEGDGLLAGVALRFGCGTRDETFRTMGVTHLVEALVMDRLAAVDQADFGSFFSLDETRFHGYGTLDEAARFLEAVCRTLSDLPLDRLEHVAGRLDIEQAAPVDEQISQVLGARYGAHGLGLACHHGTGYRELTPEMVRTHAATYFTRANAALMVTGPVPPGLRLPLPYGARPSRGTPHVLAGHAWARRDLTGVALAYEVPVGSAAARIGHQILITRVERLVRDRLGIASAVEAYVTARDAGSVERMLLLDAEEGREDAVAAALWGEAVRLAREAPTAEEVEEEVAWCRKGFVRQPSVPAELQAASDSELYGVPYLDGPTMVRALEAITPADVREAVERAVAGALLVVPHGTPPSLTGLDGRRLEHTRVCERWDVPPPRGEVHGRPLRARLRRGGGGGDAERIVRTPRSLVWCQDDWYHEYRFDEVVELERWGDARRAVARCGCLLELVPGDFQGMDRLIRALDDAVPPARTRERAEPPNRT
ncbi:hypothetical protein [Streptomyces sp. NPDC058613]|uniref:hypothetical protein n=1 Tax=Streptomyces sp. NPDC058613 TaxID=3346556 RepID=UPI0036574764